MILFDVAPIVAAILWIQCTWYGVPHHGQVMRNGEVYNMHDPTVIAVGVDRDGEPLIPLGTKLRVCSPRACIIGKVQDTGYLGRNIDLSVAAFSKLADLGEGRMWVSVEEQ